MALYFYKRQLQPKKDEKIVLISNTVNEKNCTIKNRKTEPL